MDEPVVLQVGERSERMLTLEQLWTADRRHVFFGQKLGHDPFVAACAVTYRDVDPVPYEIRERARCGEPHVDVAMLCVKPVEPRDEPAASKAVRGADVEDAGASHDARDARRSADAIQRQTDLLGIERARRSEPHGPRASFEEQDAESILEVADGATDRAVCHVQLGRRFREAQVASCRVKGWQCSQRREFAGHGDV